MTQPAPGSTASILDQYAQRVEYLHVIVNEEGGTIRQDSEQDFRNFVQQHPFKKPGQIVVTHEGHIRLTWRGDHESSGAVRRPPRAAQDEEHLGIRFLGGQRVRYVIFSRRADDQTRLETAGDDSFNGLVSQAQAHGLNAFSKNPGGLQQ